MGRSTHNQAAVLPLCNRNLRSGAEDHLIVRTFVVARHWCDICKGKYASGEGSEGVTVDSTTAAKAKSRTPSKRDTELMLTRVMDHAMTSMANPSGDKSVKDIAESMKASTFLEALASPHTNEEVKAKLQEKYNQHILSML